MPDPPNPEAAPREQQGGGPRGRLNTIARGCAVRRSPFAGGAEGGPVLRAEPGLEAGRIGSSKSDAIVPRLSAGDQRLDRGFRARDGSARHDEPAVLAAIDHLVFARAVAIGLDPDEERFAA